MAMLTTTTAPATIEQTDWQPCCQSPNCQAGHPEATHIQVFFGAVLRCGCKPPSQLLCTDCVERIASFPRRQHWHCGWGGCGYAFDGWQHEWSRIEALP